MNDPFTGEQLIDDKEYFQQQIVNYVSLVFATSAHHYLTQRYLLINSI